MGMTSIGGESDQYEGLSTGTICPLVSLAVINIVVANAVGLAALGSRHKLQRPCKESLCSA